MHLGFNAPFGYDFKDDELVINKIEAKTIISIFQAYIGGSNLQEIAAVLNQEGITTKKGNAWSRWAFGYILRNPIYAGYLYWDGHISKGKHEPIIDVGTFNDAQKRRRKPILIET